MASATMAGQTGAFLLTGGSPTLFKLGVEPDTGLFVLTGNSAQLARSRVLRVNRGAFSIRGLEPLLLAVYPKITPSRRSFSVGIRPTSTYSSMAGIEIRFSHGSREINQQLALGYENITEAEAIEIYDHYRSAGTTFNTFTLPAAVFVGLNDYSWILKSGNEWRYASPPKIESTMPGYMNVEIEFIGVYAG